MIVALIAVAAAAGASGRYLLDQLLQGRFARVFPLSTLVVNLAGSLLLGLLVGLAGRVELPTGLVAVVGGGLLGSFTTFSTFALESVRLLEAGALARALLYVALSLGGGLLAAAAGLTTAALLRG